MDCIESKNKLANKRGQVALMTSPFQAPPRYIRFISILLDVMLTICRLSQKSLDNQLCFGFVSAIMFCWAPP